MKRIAVFRQRLPSAQSPFVQGSPTKDDSLNTTVSLHFSRCHPHSPFDGRSIEGRQNDALQTPFRLPLIHEGQSEYGVDLRDDIPTQLTGRKQTERKILLTKRICWVQIFYKQMHFSRLILLSIELNFHHFPPYPTPLCKVQCASQEENFHFLLSISSKKLIFLKCALNFGLKSTLTSEQIISL